MTRRLGPAFVAIAMLAAHTVQAQDTAEVVRAWHDWMVENERTAGGIAVLRGGNVVLERAMGHVTPSTVVPLASLSKAVTAVCVAGLIERGRLAFDMTLKQALPHTLARDGPPADARLAGVTLAQLLTHRAGYQREGTSDPETKSLAAYLRRATASRTAFDERLRAVLEERLALTPGERYAYTNAAYLVLGTVIEEATGESYEAYCRNTVLAPMGIESAELDPRWRILSSFGGWHMTLADYGRFYQSFARTSLAIGSAERRWMLAPAGKTIGGGAHYGLGTFVRPIAGGDANYWHWGRWIYQQKDAHDGILSASYSTFAARWGALDVNVVAYVEPAMRDFAIANELDRALGQAARSVRRWP